MIGKAKVTSTPAADSDPTLGPQPAKRGRKKAAETPAPEAAAATPVPTPEQPGFLTPDAPLYHGGAKYAMSQFDQDALANRYNYHAPFGDQPERYCLIRAACLDLAKRIVELTPKSREQSVALSHLDEVMFNANAAIARNEMKTPLNVDSGLKSPAEMKQGVEQPKA